MLGALRRDACHCDSQLSQINGEALASDTATVARRLGCAGLQSALRVATSAAVVAIVVVLAGVGSDRGSAALARGSDG